MCGVTSLTVGVLSLIVFCVYVLSLVFRFFNKLMFQDFGECLPPRLATDRPPSATQPLHTASGSHATPPPSDPPSRATADCRLWRLCQNGYGIENSTVSRLLRVRQELQFHAIGIISRKLRRHTRRRSAACASMPYNRRTSNAILVDESGSVGQTCVFSFFSNLAC